MRNLTRTLFQPEKKVFPSPKKTLQLLPYQVEGVDFIESRKHAICADEMGLGKTIQAIAVINRHVSTESMPKILIVCPASLCLNWRHELRTWLTPLVATRSTAVLPGICVIGTPGHNDLYADITIVSYDRLHKVKSKAFDICFLDEAHYIKNPKTQRTRRVMALRSRVGRFVCLTGTPILNRPVDLWPLLQLTDPDRWDPPGLRGKELVGKGEGAGFFPFALKYCGAKKRYIGRKSYWDFTGSDNLSELRGILRETVMIRRLKSEVLKDLPAKRRQVVPVEVKSATALLREEWRIFGDETEDLTAAKVKFTELSKVRRELALKKVPAAIDHILNALESNEKIVIFAHHHEVIAALESALVAAGEIVPVITGDVPTHERQALVNLFQGGKACRVILGSIGAMGTGFTLTAASLVIFVEIDWSPSAMSQAEDRLHRIGQRQSVLAQHLIVEGSLDARMIELVIKKQEDADLALDSAGASLSFEGV